MTAINITAPTVEAAPADPPAVPVEGTPADPLAAPEDETELMEVPGFPHPLKVGKHVPARRKPPGYQVVEDTMMEEQLKGDLLLG